MNDVAIGYKGLCISCYFGKTENKNIICENKHSRFYGLRTNELLLAPCFKKRIDSKMQAITF